MEVEVGAGAAVFFFCFFVKMSLMSPSSLSGSFWSLVWFGFGLVFFSLSMSLGEGDWWRSWWWCFPVGPYVCVCVYGPWCIGVAVCVCVCMCVGKRADLATDERVWLLSGPLWRVNSPRGRVKGRHSVRGAQE